MFKHQDNHHWGARIPILMYHEVNTPNSIPLLSKKIQYSFILTTDQFESQIRLLSRMGYQSCSLDGLCSWLAGDDHHQISHKPIILTFDDGYEGNYKFALPILQKYGFAATFFVIVNKIGQPAMVSWSQLLELEEAGMSVQSHTMTHPLLSTLSSEAIFNELKNSKKVLEERLKNPVHYISLPYGSYDHRFKEIAIRLGYKGGCTSNFGFVHSNSDCFLLDRIIVKSTHSLDQFRKIVEQDRGYLKRIFFARALKNRIKRTIGERMYNNLYNYVFGVAEESKK